MRRRSGGRAEVAPSMVAISRLGVSALTQTTPMIQTIREGTGVGDKEGDPRADQVDDPVEMDQEVTAGMEEQEDSDLYMIS